MLVRFSVENFKSFKDQIVFSMVATKGTRHSDHIHTMNTKRILKGSFLFGANASGKSNFVEAIAFAQKLVLQGVESVDSEKKHFRLSKDSATKPGVFQFEFMVDKLVYSYGFAFSYSSKSIVSEWLTQTLQDTPKYVFNRETAEDGVITVETEMSIASKSDKNKFAVYASDFKNVDNFPLLRTFMLTDIAKRGNSDSPFFKAFTEAFNWMKSLVVLFPNSKYMGLGSIATDEAKRHQFALILQYFDTGIQSIEAEEISLDKLLQEMPDTTRQNLIQDLNAQIGKTPKMYSDGTNFFTLRRDSEGNIVASKMLLDHGNADELFESREESDGTRRLFDLIPLLLQRESRVIVIDEIDRSLHSKLVEEFIAKFYENTKGSAIQLIASTHDSNVLDLQKLRQDEIWFIERQQDCSSRLFSLSEFKERFDRNIEKDYLLGRYGAIPLFKTWEAESSGE